MHQQHFEIIPEEVRNLFWQQYETKRKTFCGKVIKFWYWGWFRVSRWYHVSVGVFLLQVLFILSWIVEFAGVIAIALLDMQNAETKPERWVKVIVIAQAIGAVIIGWYKSTSSSLKGMTDAQADRRNTTTEVLKRVTANGAVDKSKLIESNLSLHDICRCIWWDVREFLQLGERDGGVCAFTHIPDKKNGGPGTLKMIARDRQTGSDWVDRPALSTYNYEAIRRRQTVIFHDVRTKLVSDTFRDHKKREYRTVAAIPIFPPGQRSNPVAMVAVNISYPYALTGKGHQLQKRLQAYFELANIFISEEAENADDQR
jgi:hypothetical protein